MTIYWVLVALVFIIGEVIKPSKARQRARIYLWLCFIMMLVISGFRAFSVGADTETYVNIFNNIGRISLKSGKFEIGFMLYVRILHLLSSDPGILLLVSSAICIGTACVFTYKFSKNPILSILLYILLGAFFSQMNIMRQAIAMSIMVISYMVLLKDNRKWGWRILSALLILLAMSFHFVAIVGFVPWGVLLFGKREEEKNSFTVAKMLRIAIIISIAVIVVYPVITALVARILPRYAEYFKGTWSDINLNASLFNTLIQLAFAVVGALVFRNRKLDQYQRFSAIMLLFAIVFNVLSMRMEIWSRIAGMFDVYTYLLWAPEITSAFESVNYRNIVKTVVVLFSIAYMLIVLIFRPEWTQVVPYLFR